MENLWPRIEGLLGQATRPSRYINHEYQSVHCKDAEYRAVFAYPDVYEIGQSNQAVNLLYDIVNRLPGCAAERAFLPWVDMAALMRERGLPLFSLEGMWPLTGFEMLGVTIPHELAATNIIELLDLAGLPHRSCERLDDVAGTVDNASGRWPLVVGGGPAAFNPEPLAPFFDVIAIGESEELICELVAKHRAWLATPGGRLNDLLCSLAEVEGIYVPSFGSQRRVRRRVFGGFAEELLPKTNIVPFCETIHDRLAIEIQRGCSRGCRFCQAGMTYRPVRERPSDMIVQAAMQGIACTGFDEVSLVSLSSTDHSHIEDILRRLQQCFAGTGVSVSLPSQRLDAFGVDMAGLVAGERKSGLTFAPEAGSQRLRDVINKNVSTDDLLLAIQRACEGGWRRCKLYFMIGLPTETDEDVVAIADLANAAYIAAKDAVPQCERGKIRISLSVAVFVPKPGTPFQWSGQLPLAEVSRRIGLLRQAGLAKAISLKWHDPQVSQVEAVLARSGREVAELIEAAWQEGASFAAWTERFDYQQWLVAAERCGIDLDAAAADDYRMDEPLPWQHIETGISQRYLEQEWQCALEGQVTEDCSFARCTECGVCLTADSGGQRPRIVLEGERHE
ncbi:MAG: radical SAM protein [Actinomycetia bacterium]|nr:radical SAM protein [Actinomycetes bacterium]